jgi:hypothetical protein
MSVAEFEEKERDAHLAAMDVRVYNLLHYLTAS